MHIVSQRMMPAPTEHGSLITKLGRVALEKDECLCCAVMHNRLRLADSSLGGFLPWTLRPFAWFSAPGGVGQGVGMGNRIPGS